MNTQFNSKHLALLKDIRRCLEGHFQQDTAYPGTQSQVASAGHCAIVSAITALTVGGTLASTKFNGVSHWFNRLFDGQQWWDIDLTGDQFGLPAIQVTPAGKLYSATAVQPLAALNSETLQRALVLAGRSGISTAVEPLRRLLMTRQADEQAIHV